MMHSPINYKINKCYEYSNFQRVGVNQNHRAMLQLIQVHCTIRNSVDGYSIMYRRQRFDHSSSGWYGKDLVLFIHHSLTCFE